MKSVPPAPKKHVILFLAANPSGTDRLALDREARSIHAELKRSGYRDRFDFVTRWAAEPLDLLREVRELKPTVVHFSGHGGPHMAAAAGSAHGRDVVAGAAPSGGEPHGLSFHDVAGSVQVVSPEAIAQTLGSAGASVRLIVLNACFTAPIAAALLAHVDCVVGMSGSIHDDAARSFAIGFYGGLGEHESIAAAFAQGRAAINLDEGLSDSERPQLQVRDGFDATQLILAAVAPALRLDVPCPYPGMRSYTADDAERFHGRGAEIDELIGRLRAGEREIYMIGPSGSGKSSLVAAGVLPRLARGVSGLGPFVVRTLRPGEQPVARLYEALDLSPGQPFVAADRIAALLAHRGRDSSVLLVIDQLEELFTLPSAGERDAFLLALCELRGERRCAVIVTLRADFFGALMESPLWPEGRGRDQLSRIEVGPLRGQALRDAITAPAHDVGVAVEPELIERLLADAASEPGILPLLQEALIQLWDARTDQVLTLIDYQELGDGERSGLAVALARRADASLRRFNAAQTDIARRILLRLISFGEGRSDTRRQQPRAKLRAADDDAADFDHVLQAMIDDRLLTIDDDDRGGEPLVDLAHEILIVAWPALAGWVQSHRVDEQRRRQLEAVATQWAERGRGVRGLLDPSELADAETWQRTESAVQLGQSAEVLALIAASRVAQARQRRRRRALITAGVLMAAGLAIAAFVLTRPPTPSCADEGAAIAQVWNPTAAAVLRGKFSTAGPYRDQMFTSMNSELTHYASAWSALRTSACAAQRAGDATAARSLACLDARRALLTAEIAHLIKNVAPEQIPSQAHLIEPVETCAHPAPASDFQDVIHARMEISKATTLWAAGDRDGGRRQLDELFAKLEPLGYPPIRAEILLVSAQLQSAEDDIARAEANLRKALTMAEGAGDDRVKLKASAMLAGLLANHDRLDEAAHEVEQADAALARLGGDLTLEAKIAAARGTIAMKRGALDEAVKHLTHAVDLEEQVPDGDLLADVTLIRVYDKLGRQALADAVLARVRKRSPTMPDPRDLTRGQSTDVGPENCARQLMNAELDRARASCTAALAKVEREQGAGSLSAAQHHRLLARVHTLRGDHRGAHDEDVAAAKIYEARDVKDQLAETMEYTGQQSLELGDATAAFAEYQRSIDTATALGKLGEEQLAYSRAGRGRALAAAHRDADAIGELEWAIPHIEVLPKPGHRTLASSRLALADALWRRAQPGDRTDARVEAGKAYKDALARRADLDAHDPQTPLERRVDDQLAARIAAWQANHR